MHTTLYAVRVLAHADLRHLALVNGMKMEMLFRYFKFNKLMVILRLSFKPSLYSYLLR